MYKVVFLMVLAASLASASESEPIQKRGLFEEADKIVQESRHISVNNVGQLVDLVKRHNAVDCLRRVICELTSNPQIYESAGSRFGKALLNFRQSKHPDIKMYLDAMTQGARSKWTECETFYHSCTYPTRDIISVGNKVLHS